MNIPILHPPSILFENGSPAKYQEILAPNCWVPAYCAPLIHLSHARTQPGANFYPFFEPFTEPHLLLNARIPPPSRYYLKTNTHNGHNYSCQQHVPKCGQQPHHLNDDWWGSMEGVDRRVRDTDVSSSFFFFLRCVILSFGWVFLPPRQEAGQVYVSRWYWESGIWVWLWL